MPVSLVDSFQHLKGRPKTELSLPLLQRIASLVKPVMRGHGWKLPVLAEFFPDDPGLLGQNMNSGQKILLRLRPPWSPDTFYDEEQLVSVMLHELTHNVHGPHDDKFYKYLSDLEAEYDALRRSGYDGEGFHSTGNRLGVGVSHNLPPHLARVNALQAAERRRAQQKVFGAPGGQRLGGRSPVDSRLMSPRELAVQAAERRARDEKSCGTSKESSQREAEKAAKDSIENRADTSKAAQREFSSLDNEIILYPPVDQSPAGMSLNNTDWTCPACTLDNLPSALECLACLSTRPKENTKSYGKFAPVASPSRAPPVSRSSNYLESSTTSSRDVDYTIVDAGWACQACTLINPDHLLRCSVCSAVHPKCGLKDGWKCRVCGEDGLPHEFWSCRFCGSIKDSSSLSSSS